MNCCNASSLQRFNDKALKRNYPCLCLWRGFLQMTRTTFLRFTILQLAQSLFTEGRTFINPREDKRGIGSACHFWR